MIFSVTHIMLHAERSYIHFTGYTGKGERGVYPRLLATKTRTRDRSQPSPTRSAVCAEYAAIRVAIVWGALLVTAIRGRAVGRYYSVGVRSIPPKTLPGIRYKIPRGAYCETDTVVNIQCDIITVTTHIAKSNII